MKQATAEIKDAIDQSTAKILLRVGNQSSLIYRDNKLIDL